MREFITSGRVVDAIIAFMAIEALVLYVGPPLLVRSLSVREIASMLLPGLALLLALRAALTGGPWTIIALYLALALIAHLADLWTRASYRPNGDSPFSGARRVSDPVK